MNKPYVLCVEDDETDVLLMKRVFSQKLTDFDCHFESNVDDCVRFLEKSLKDQRLPALMLVDIKLINSNGLTLLKIVKGDIRFDKIPVVILSSSDRDDDKNQAKERGCDAYHEKPRNYVDFKLKIPSIVLSWTKNKENDR